MSVYSNNTYSKSTPNDAWHKVFKFVPPNSKILDIGCSSGRLGMALRKEKKVHIIGVDIDKDDVALAKKNLDDAFVINIETDDATFLGQFDAIIMADVIEHLVDPVSALKKIKRLLKPTGRLIFSIPNMANVTTRIELIKGRFEYKDFGLLDRTHLHFYDKKEVERVFRESGFNVIETDCTTREVPEDILRNELADVGIDLTPKLAAHLNDSDALTYQFIGYAIPAAKPKKFNPATTSPLDSVSIYIDQLNKAHNKELLNRDKAIAQLDEQIASLRASLNAILNSRGWKALDKIYTVKKKLHRKS